jgi:hypothetical protein
LDSLCKEIIETSLLAELIVAFEAPCFAFNLSKQEDVLRDLVAALVIDCAQTGELDSGRLCELVVFSFKQRFWCA